MQAKLARRAFLSLPLAASALAAGEVKRVKGIKLRIAINAYSFNRPLMAHTMTLDDVLDYCAAHNVDGLDATGYYSPAIHKRRPTTTFIS